MDLSVHTKKSHLNRTLPVYLLTGFLGSGKSTLLKAMLESADFQRTLVIINEFGSVGIDHLLVDKSERSAEKGSDVVLLESGCLCCSVKGELRDTLKRLARTDGSAVPFDKIIIETTGLATPGPILGSIGSDPFLSHHYRIGGVLTVVDPVADAVPSIVQREWQMQIAAGDTLYVSKTDLASEERIKVFVQTLKEMNPAADILLSRAASGTDALRQLIVSLFRDPDEKNKKFINIPLRKARALQQTPTDDPSHLNTVQAISLPLPASIDWSKFSIWLSLLLYAYGDRVLRSKGIVTVAGHDRALIIHSVGRYLFPPEHYAGPPPASELVMIVCGLEVDRIQRSFSHFLINSAH